MKQATAAELFFGLAATETLEPEVVALEARRAQEREWYGITIEELATAQWDCCTNKVPLTETELDLIRVAKRGRKSDVLPWPRCLDCERQMTMSTRPSVDTRTCPWCLKPIAPYEKFKTVSVIPFRQDPRVFELRWAHSLCATEAGGEKITSMATYKSTLGMPGCRMCGRPYTEHHTYVTTIWDAYCDTDEFQWYRPAAPARSRNWPYRLMVDSPHYTTDGKIAYAETEDEAVERLRAMAAA